MKQELKEEIARNAASTWCRCFKCDGIIRENHFKCDKETLTTCLQWYHGYRTALLALGDKRVKELNKRIDSHHRNQPISYSLETV